MPKIDILPIEKPYFDESGKIHLPAEIILWDFLTPALTPREWKIYLWHKADKSQMESEPYVYELAEKRFCGDRTTKWRGESALKRKGYL